MNSSYKQRPPQGRQQPPQGKSLKNKLRSLQRLLNREKNPGLPRPAVHGKVRLMRKLEAAAKVHDIESREKRYSELYHHVKFFERRKAERRLKKAQKKLEDLRGGGGGIDDDDDDKSGDKDVKKLLEECEEEVKECEQNVLYVKWFPKHIKYVSLYPSRSASKDEQLDIRRAALRRWTLINAEAKMFVPTPPEQDGNVDFGEEEEEEEENKEEEDGGKKKKKNKKEEDDDDDDEKEEVPVKASIKQQPTSSSSLLLSQSKSASKPAANGVGIVEGKKRKRADAVEAVKLPSRPVAPSLSLSSRRGGLEGNSHELVDFEDDAAVAAEAGGASGISQDDAFFSSVPVEEDRNAVHAPPVFVELAPEDDPSFGDAYGGNSAEDGNWRSAPSFNGQRTSAARFERERLGADSKRYRDSAASAAGAKRPSTFSKSAPGNGDGGGGGGGGEGKSASSSIAEDTSKLDGLLGRKRKRAERALKFEQSRGGGGAAVLGVGGLNKAAASSYDEAFFGTSRDQGAKLKHQERIKAADRKLLNSSTAAAARTGRASLYNNNKNNHISNNRGGGGGGGGGESSVMPVIHHAIPKRLVSSIASAGKSTRMTFD